MIIKNLSEEIVSLLSEHHVPTDKTPEKNKISNKYGI